MQWSDSTPPPDRGTLRPKQGGVDYLKMTIWAPSWEVQTFLEETLISRWLIERHTEWRELGPMKRVTACWEGAGGLLRVLEYGAADFVSVEIRGQGCSVLGHAVLQGFLVDLAAKPWKSRASRLDYAWDGCPFTPRQVYDAARGGAVNSRSIRPEEPDTIQFHESPKVVGVESGETAYLGRRTGERFIRVYDKRGPTRLEIELKGKQAAKAVVGLTQTDIDQWGDLLLALLRDTVDFIDLSHETRPTRAPLLPWWEAFVADAGKGFPEGVGSLDNSGGITPLGRLEMAFQRASVNLAAALEVFGESYVLQRLRYYAERKPEMLAARVKELREWEIRARLEGLVGVPRDIPF